MRNPWGTPVRGPPDASAAAVLAGWAGVGAEALATASVGACMVVVEAKATVEAGRC